MGGMGMTPILPIMGVGCFIERRKEIWMKKPLISLIALTASVISANSFAASNMENPLYMPKNREVYLKTGAAVMYKKADSTEATRAKNANGQEEFPIWRFSGDIGYGITDRLDIHGHFGYTHDEDIRRQGMHRGRIGLMYRLLTEEQPFVLDLYTDAYLSGVSPMKGTYKRYGDGAAFDFDNYSNGRWGAIFGTRFGKTWNDFTLAAHVEYLQTFGNHNNEIGIDPTLQPLKGQPGIPAFAEGLTMPQLGFPREISVNLKSTNETVAGFDAMYQINTKWSFGTGFEFIEHSDNGVKSIHTKLKNPDGAIEALTPLIGAENATLYAKKFQEGVKEGLLEKTKDMKDGWNEYVIKANLAYSISDDVQVAVFAEYTLDDSHSGSQNGTDVKTEAGFRFNARF